MPADLDARLRRYADVLDRETRAVTLDEVIDLAAPTVTAAEVVASRFRWPGTRRIGWGLGIAALAGLIVIVAIGAVALFGLLGGDEEAPVVTEPPPVTTVPPPETTLPPATTTPSATTVPPPTTAPPITTLPTTTATTLPPAPALEWERVPNLDGVFDDALMTAVAPGGPGLVAVGYVLEASPPADFASDAAVWVSTDATVWDRVDDPELPAGPGDQEIADIAVGPLGLLALGNDGFTPVLLTSPDGVVWTRIDDETVSSVFIGGVAAGGPGWVAAGGDDAGNAAVLVSADGVFWDRVESEAFAGGLGPDALFMYDVAAGGPGLVAVGSRGSDDPHGAIWVSEDGLTWQRLREDTAGGDRQLESVSADPASSALVAFGWRTPWISTDGLEWVPAVDPEGFDNDIPPPSSEAVWDGDRIVAGGYGMTPASLWASLDRGATWSQIDASGEAFDGNRPAALALTRVGDRIIAVGGDEGVSIGQTLTGQPRIGFGGEGMVWIGTWNE